MNALGPGANNFKIDICRAFRHIRIDPGDIDLLGLTHKGQFFVYLSLPIGFYLGYFFFQKLNDVICYIMTKNGHNALLNYIDDLIYFGLPSSMRAPYDFC